MSKELLRTNFGVMKSMIPQDPSYFQQLEEDVQLALSGRPPSMSISTPFDYTRHSHNLMQSQYHKSERHQDRRNDANMLLSSTANTHSVSYGPPELLPGVYHHVLHRVSCRQDIQLYTDIPTRTVQPGHFHLSGQNPVVDLQAIKNQSSLAFIAFRDEACQNQGTKQNAGQVLISHTNCEESINIIDPGLRSEIDAVARCTYNRVAYASSSSSQRTPDEEDEIYFLFFCYHRDALAARIPAASSPTKEYLQDLLSYIQEAYGTILAQFNSWFSKGMVHRDHLEMLFCPNDTILWKQEDTLTAFVLRSQPSGSSSLSAALQKECHQLSLARPSTATVNIRDLEIFPLSYATDEEKEHLVQRGQKFWKLTSQNLATYSGLDAPNDNFYSNETRCVIDYSTYWRMHPNAGPFRPQPKIDKLPFDLWPESVSLDAMPAEDIIIQLPAFIHGYVIKDKSWVALFIDQIEPVTWNKNAYECLILPQKNQGHGESSGDVTNERRMTLLEVKETGLSCYFMGPGTGKSLTAESVAEIAEMPLLRVTCGEIGTTAETIEAYLRKIFILTKAWNCILLLDEADSFLEECSLSDFQRHGLVSVFLRVLESYDGIIILRSNRVGTFDEAFKSRIQVAVHFPDLGRAPRKKIWRNFLDMLEADEENADFKELNEHLDELAGYELNGRQIRNALTTARELALFQKETLGWEHLEQSLGVIRSFDDYLKKEHGHSEDQYARDSELR